MTTDRRTTLIAATAHVAKQHGVQNITLEAVAEAAGISKGGLLYHYPTKDHLFIALSEYAISTFQRAFTAHQHAGKNPHEAYIYATLDGLADTEHLMHHTAGILVAAAQSPEALALWQAEYARLRSVLAASECPPHLSLLIQTACDGAWFSVLLGLQHREGGDLHRALHVLLDVLETEAA